jgi:hypothetical protein
MAEDAVEHVRNALQLLMSFKEMNPSIWKDAPELVGCAMRLTHALNLLNPRGWPK